MIRDVNSDISAAAVIAALDLQPHPEGGYFRETHRSAAAGGERAAVSQIYYLLAAGEVSAWHRIDATEIWHAYAGAPLRLDIAETDGMVRSIVLGAAVTNGETAHGVVPPGAWQSAESLGAWSLVGCTVAPAFEFSSFEMAPTGWVPGDPLPNGPPWTSASTGE